MGLTDALPPPSRTWQAGTAARHTSHTTSHATVHDNSNTEATITHATTITNETLKKREKDAQGSVGDRRRRLAHVPPYGERAIDAYTYSHSNTISTSSSNPSPGSTNSQQQQQQHAKTSRKPFIPRSDADFAGGGAYPEIHFAQYPLGLGRKAAATASSSSNRTSNANSTSSVSSAAQPARDGYGRAALALRATSVGNSDSSAIATTGGMLAPSAFEAVVNHTLDPKKQTRHTALVPRRFEEEDLARPDAAEVDATVAETQRVLEALTQTRLRGPASGPVAAGGSGKNAGNSQFVRYTPVDQQQRGALGQAPPSSKIIKLTEAAVDPLALPKHKIRKVPRVKTEEPAPVMHSPPRKLTAADHAAWQIPPCVSLWKNNAGYTIPLHTRLAADGRHLEEHTISQRFGGFADALYAAEHAAREEVRTHAEVEARIAAKKKQEQETRLDELARQVYSEATSSTIAERPAAEIKHLGDSSDEDQRQMHDDSQNEQARRERERIRMERQRERERELRLQRAGRGGQLEREKRRDVSERVALGGESAAAGAPGVGKSSDALFDARLFNQTSGMSSGLGDEESYNVYSKPLFAGAAARNALYKRTGSSAADYGNDEDWATLQDTSRFQPSRAFSGAGGDSNGAAIRDSGPVQFERAERRSGSGFDEDRREVMAQQRQRERQREVDEGDDPFGLNEFHTEVTNRRGADGLLSRIGRGGQMAAASAGGTGAGGDQTAFLREGGSKRSRVEFTLFSSKDSSHHDKRQRQ